MGEKKKTAWVNVSSWERIRQVHGTENGSGEGGQDLRLER